MVAIRAQVTTEAPAKVEKVSKKVDKDVVTNTFRPKEPYVGKCLLNTKITGDDAPGETWHMVFSTEGAYAHMVLFKSQAGYDSDLGSDNWHWYTLYVEGYSLVLGRYVYLHDICDSDLRLSLSSDQFNFCFNRKNTLLGRAIHWNYRRWRRQKWETSQA